MSTATVEVTEYVPVSNDAEETYQQLQPYIAEVGIEGVCPIIFHRWSCEDVEAKAKAAKGSKAKKTDNVEAYLWRNEKGVICLPSEYLRQSIVHAAKFRQDPRSPRKSAMDLFKAGVATIDELCSLGKTKPDYIDQRHAVVQRQGVTRQRPALKPGWGCTVKLLVLLPEYITPQILNEVIQYAGRIVGVAEIRPSYGRFQVVMFNVMELH